MEAKKEGEIKKLTSSQTKYQNIEFQVAGIGAVVEKTVKLDLNYEKLTGIAFDMNTDDGSAMQSYIGIKIANQELLPENYPIKAVLFNRNISPSERFIYVNEVAAGNELTIKFTNKRTTANAYLVNILFKLER